MSSEYRIPVVSLLPSAAMTNTNFLCRRRVLRSLCFELAELRQMLAADLPDR